MPFGAWKIINSLRKAPRLMRAELGLVETAIIWLQTVSLELREEQGLGVIHSLISSDMPSS